jgi:hypothetical protein
MKNEVHCLLMCPLYILATYNFVSLFENVVLGSLKSFFHLDHQVHISIYITEAIALYHSKQLVGFKPPPRTLCPMSCLAPIL